MKILNIMLSRGLGGIQQSFLDYGKALEMQNCDVINVVSSCAKITPPASSKKYTILNLCSFDPISIFQIKRIVTREKPDAIIAHGNRAIKFCLDNPPPLIGVAHNYNTKWLPKCDYIFATTNHLKRYWLEQGCADEKVMVLPNMISLASAKTHPQKTQERVIGTMGRFVKKKGFDIFLIALSLLKSKGINFKAVIGGDGEEESHLRQLATKLGLDNHITFSGWVSDKEKFFDQIDIFCLPSTHEPFGIILLEAMARYKPIVSTRSEGPLEIIREGKTGLLCNMTAADLADKLTQVLEDQGLAQALSKNAFADIEKNYESKIVSKKMINYLKKILI